MGKHCARWRYNEALSPYASTQPQRYDEPLGYCEEGLKKKRQYETEEEAQRVAAYAMDNGAPPLRPYVCMYCFLWHLTSKTNSH